MALVLFVYSQQDRAIHLSYDDFVRLIRRREGRCGHQGPGGAEAGPLFQSDRSARQRPARRRQGRRGKEFDSSDDKKNAAAAGTPISFYVNKSEKDDDLPQDARRGES